MPETTTARSRAATSPAAQTPATHTLKTQTLTQTPAVRVALVGVHGYGLRHLDNLARLQAVGDVDLVAVADPNPPADGVLGEHVAIFGSLQELLDAGTAPDLVILATPIQTHAPLALAAIAAGSDVYLEKPPVASMAQFEAVLAAAEEAGRLVQVGFQSLGSHALPAIERLVAAGGIGEVRGVGAMGTWVRDLAYFKRSRWAGKRSLDGTDVVDGVATNALAHAVATALSMAGAHTIQDVASVETDLYHAHATESDDTSVIRVRTAAGTVLLCALTLCADQQTAPSVTVYGTQGKAELFYTEDRLTISTPDGERTEAFERADLLENLLEARRSAAPLLSPLAWTGAFMTVLEAIRTAPAPLAIPVEHVSWEGTGGNAHPVVHNIRQLIRRAVLAQSTFSELGVPWARPAGQLEPAGQPESAGQQDLRPQFMVDGKVVAREADGSGIMATSSPRPYLHPVTTLSGTVVTDHLPEDHVWHLGAGVAIQDVDGINFWGGRTYTREAGAYVWRPDHGRIVIRSAEQVEDSRTENLSWLGPDGNPVLSEKRQWNWTGVDPVTWRLTLRFTLSPAGSKPVTLGSPGSNGRHQGGYGGFFWRLPACQNADVRTALATGEMEVHGTVAPWLAWSADFEGRAATLVFIAAGGSTDPWFVRVDGYPGVGQSLAWEEPVIAGPDTPVERSLSVLVADGRLSNSDVENLINSLGDNS
jgi:predicted dehydrogenase